MNTKIFVLVVLLLVNFQNIEGGKNLLKCTWCLAKCGLILYVNQDYSGCLCAPKACRRI